MSTVDSVMAGASGRAKQKALGSGADIIPEGYSSGRMKNFDKQQMELYKNSFSHLGPDSYLSRLAGGDQSMFEEMEAPAHRQFNELQGNLASRFSGQGMGNRKGSAFQNATTQATSDFAQDLQSKRLGLRNQAIKDLMEMSGQLLGQRPYEKFLEKKDQSSSGWGSTAGAALGGLGGFLSGGPAGALGGAKLGYDVGSGF